MKNKSGIWIDGTKALIVTLTNNTHTIESVNSGIENKVHHDNEGDKGSFQGGQHINNEKKFEERKKNQLNEFLNNVILHLNGTDELFIFGPAEVKTHLKSAIEHDQHLSHKLKAIESSEQMSDNQIIAKVKHFFNEN